MATEPSRLVMRWKAFWNGFANGLITATGYIVPVGAMIGGWCIARGDWIPGVAVLIVSAARQALLVDYCRLLQRFHEAEYRRLTGKEP